MKAEDNETWFGAYNSDGTGSSRSKAGNKYKLAHTPFQLGKRWRANRYTNLAGFKGGRYTDVLNNVNYLLSRLNEMTVDQDYVQKVLSGEIELKIKVNSYFDINWRKIGGRSGYGYYVLYGVEEAPIPIETIRQLSHKNILEKFIKFLYIFDRNRLEIKHWAWDYSSSWPVSQAYYWTGADIGKHYQNLGSENNDRKDTFGIGFIYGATWNQPFYDVNGNIVYERVAVGRVEQLSSSGDWNYVFSREWDTGEGRSAANACIRKFMRYFYAVVNNKWPPLHPWIVNKNDHSVQSNPVLAFLEALKRLANY